MRYLYSFLFYLALPFVFLRLLWRSRKTPEYRRRWGERLGFSPSFQQCLWLHSVSVGETLAAVPLIKALKEAYPHLPLVVTNMTPTGAARVKAAFGDKVTQVYIPYDLPMAVSRFLKRLQPKIAVIMETELWPNLFHECKKQGVPIVIANARLSAKSAAGYAHIQPLTRDMLHVVSAIASQGKADAERFIELGMAADKVTVTGNIKFDIELPANLTDTSHDLRQQLGQSRLIWIAASTHPTEEEIMLVAHKKILETFPNALLILVPRHPDRFNAVAELIKQNGFQLARRSLQEVCSLQTAVYLGDTMGEMLLMLAAADVAFVAGSFAPIGGHNVLEPAVLGKPVVTGTQLFNFAEISDMLLSNKGMVTVKDSEELAQMISQLFQDNALRIEMGENARRVVLENRGALKKQLELIQGLIK